MPVSFFSPFVVKQIQYILQQVFEEVNRKWEVPPSEHGSTTFNPYTDPEHHNAQCHRQTDRQTVE